MTCRSLSYGGTSDAVIGSHFKQGESMKKTYQHRPGLFGLASIAAGCAAKNREVRSQGDSTAAGGHRQIQTESRSEPGKSKISNRSNGSGSGTGQ